MFKKINMFALALLIIGQTILGPIGIASANEFVEPVSQSVEQNTEVNEPAQEEPEIVEPETPAEQPKAEEPETSEPSEPVEDDADGDQGEDIKEENTGKGEVSSSDGEDKKTENGASSNQANAALQAATEAVEAAEAAVTNGNLTEAIYNKAVELVEALDEGKEKDALGARIEKLEIPVVMAAEFGSQDIELSSVEFKLTIDDDEVDDNYNQELDQDQLAKITYTFIGNTEKEDATSQTGSWVKGSSFSFDLPTPLVDYNSNFNSTVPITKNGITFSYKTQNNKVTVTLEEDIESPTTEQKFEMEFQSKFTLSDNEVEQELKIPDGLDGEKTITLTFKPKLEGKNVTKKDKKIEIVNGERIITWEAWVNKAGEQLTDAIVTDIPTATGTTGVGHKVDIDSVEIEQYTVNLDGTTTPTNANGKTRENFPLTLTDGKHAYKIRYKTKVTGANLSGTQTLKNKIILTNGNKEESAESSTSTTYGTALKKNLDEGSGKKNNNYKSNWEIIYNYNLSPIPESSAKITDTLRGSHKLPTNTNDIKVYKVEVNDDGSFKSQTDATVNTDYTISLDTDANSFTIEFKADNNGNVTQAYRVLYEANYDTQDFFGDTTGAGETITNVVTSDAHPNVVESERTATHELKDAILTKAYQVDFDKGELIWTITIDNEDSGKPITELEIEDNFTEAKQELVTELNDINKLGGSIALIDGDETKGFKITDGTVAANSTATITYRTKYEILADGSVHANGYKNEATAKWTSSTVDYIRNANAHYEPKDTTKDNGSKAGKFNYKDQEFTWNIKINVTKQNLEGAVLKDTLGEGHEIIDGSFRVCEDVLGTGGDTGDSSITECADSALISPTVGQYVLTNDATSFNLTFANSLNQGNNNKAYLITYKTKDSTDILGIESDNENEKGNEYDNAATFTTKGGSTPKENTFKTEPVPVANANELLSKVVQRNTSSNSTGTLTWQAEVNKSHSNLGSVVFKDKPSENLMILPDTVQYRKMIIDETSGVISYGNTNTNPWINALTARTLIVKADGSFEINLGTLNKEGYLVEYQTYVLGNADDSFNNEAKIEFGFASAANQKDNDKVNSTFAFSKSDANASATKGKVNLKKVGYNPATGDTVPLEDVTFRLMKKVGNNNRLIAEEKSDANGNLSFENVYYGTYYIEEIVAPDGYELAQTGTMPFIMSATTDTSLQDNVDKVIEIVNNKTMQPGEMCNVFTLTVKDEDGKTRDNVKVKFVQNGNDVFTPTTTTDSNGKITINQTDLPAGPYSVIEIDTNGDTIKELGLVQVKYTSPDCSDDVQPDRTLSCPNFTVTIEKGTGDARPNVEVTVKKQDQNGTEVATLTTNAAGEIEVPSQDLPAGTYDVYEGGIFLGEIIVSYLNDNCEATLDASASNVGMCETFTLTVNDRSNNPRPNVDEITIKDASDNLVSYVDEHSNTVDTFKTNEFGKISLPFVMKPGTYTVYEDGKKINTFTVDTTCEATVKPPTGGDGGWVPPTPNTCDIFTVTVKQNGTTVGANVELTFKSGATEVKGSTNADGKIVINENNLPAGKYTAYDKDGKEVGSINVSYDQDKCQDEIDLLVKACDVFTVTVKQSDKTVGAGTSVTLKDADGKTVTTGTTNKDGQITFNKDDLTAGSYTAYDKDGNKIGDVKVAYDGNCEAELNLLAPSCDVFTITVKKSGETVKAGTTLSLKDATGKTVVTGTTNVNGKIVFDKTALPTGTYTAVDQDGKEIAKVTVSYDEGKCQAVVDILLKACEHFNLTVVDTPNKTVQIKDKDGNTVATGTTDRNGKVTFTQSIPEGNYDVYIDGKKVSNLPVKDTCEGTVTPEVDTEKPDPEKPDTEKPNPEKPGDNGSGTPGGDKPGDNSGSNTPGGGTPGGDSGLNTPGGDKPGTNGNVSTPGGKLPQTGEEQFLYMIALGALLIVGGGAMFMAQRRKEN